MSVEEMVDRLEELRENENDESQMTNAATCPS